MMDASVLIAHYNRHEQLERSLWLLERQKALGAYEIIVVDDGSDFTPGLHPGPARGICVRESGSTARSPNLAWWAGYEEARGDFIILSHPEIMVPRNAISEMMGQHIPGRRSVPVIYAISPENQRRRIDEVDWKADLHLLQTLPDFMVTVTPWGFPNSEARGWQHHFGFTGQTRAEWDRFGFIPRTDMPGNDDAWLAHREAAAGCPPNPVDLAVYHQYHDRLPTHDPQGSWQEARETSVRIRRIREGS